MRSFLLLLLLLPLTANGKINVVATLPDLGALAEAVGGDAVSVTTLVKYSEDPHYVDARPSFLVPLSRADLFIRNGLEYEVGWLPPLLVNARNPKIHAGASGHLDASTAVDVLGVPSTVDRSQGDIHAGGNPHYLTSPRRAAQVAQAIGAKLAQIDPGRAAAYTARAKQVAGELRAFADATAARFAELPKERRRLVTYHRSWVYFTAWLGIEVPIEIEPRPGIPPTPAHTAKVAKTMRGMGIKLVLQEGYYPRKTSATVARIAGGELVAVDAQTRLGEQTYLDHMKGLVDEVYGALAK